MNMMIYMKRRMLATYIVAVIVLLGALLQTARSASTVERPDHMCGQYSGLKYAYCGTGRCCSNGLYCGDDWKHCNFGYCWYQCHEVPVPPFGSAYYPQSNHEVNATLHNHYLKNGDHHDDNDDLLEVRPATNASSSSSSFSSSPLSCAASLSRLPLASRHKYPFAALPAAPRPQNINASATHCGRCLKVTSFGVGGLPNQVKVRIAHEHNNQGLEVDFDTYRKLDTDGNGIAKGRMLVKYQFDSC